MHHAHVLQLRGRIPAAAPAAVASRFQLHDGTAAAAAAGNPSDPLFEGRSSECDGARPEQVTVLAVLPFLHPVLPELLDHRACAQEFQEPPEEGEGVHGSPPVAPPPLVPVTGGRRRGIPAPALATAAAAPSPVVMLGSSGALIQFLELEDFPLEIEESSIHIHTIVQHRCHHVQGEGRDPLRHEILGRASRIRTMLRIRKQTPIRGCIGAERR